MTPKYPKGRTESARPLRAVSIRQPQAAAVLVAPGPYRHPGWWTDYRGPLLIHASNRAAGDPSAAKAPSVAFGVLLGVVDLLDCITTERGDGGPDEVGYVWVLANPRPFAAPVPCVGRLGLFDVASAVVADALARIGLSALKPGDKSGE